MEPCTRAAPEPGFGAQLQQRGRKDDVVLFLCRSGVRSRHSARVATELGYANAFDILEGFEGDGMRRGTARRSAGWCKAGLPWIGAPLRTLKNVRCDTSGLTFIGPVTLLPHQRFQPKFPCQTKDYLVVHHLPHLSQDSRYTAIPVTPFVTRTDRLNVLLELPMLLWCLQSLNLVVKRTPG
jgi:rhodanese-related sulfurtransferase